MNIMLRCPRALIWRPVDQVGGCYQTVPYEVDSISMIFWHCHPQVTLAAWQEFDSQQEAVHEFVNKARSSMERDLNFSSPESLAVELDQARVSAVFFGFILDIFTIGCMLAKWRIKPILFTL